MKIISRLFSACAIQIRGSSARCIKGKILGRVLRDISSVAADNRIQDGEIWIDKIGRISFSSEIPSAIHQRCRNVLGS